MENGSFQSRLATLQFSEDTDSVISPSRSIPGWSSSADALLRQNEDLSARLKVAMQKLLQYESALDEETLNSQKMRKTQEALQDQILIWKEKERLWLEKLEQEEQKNQLMADRFPEFQTLQTEVQRYRRYHEKVKTQIKPYLQQLKEYSKNLVNEIRELNREILNKDHAQEKSLRLISDLQSELALQIKAHAASMDELKSLHLSEMKSLQSELSILRENQIILENKSTKLDQALNRQDELDNMVVILTRKLEEAQGKIHSESEGLRISLQLARNDLLKKSLTIESLEKNHSEEKNSNEVLRQETQNLQDQLSSLRFLWKEKAEENDKLKTIISSLEKVNLELSVKLKNSRS